MKYFEAVLEKFHRYSKIWPFTAVDLLGIMFGTLLRYIRTLVELGLMDRGNACLDEIHKTFLSLQNFCFLKNEHYGEQILSPDVVEYWACVHMIRGQTEEAIELVKKIVEYYIAYLNDFGEPTNVNREEVVKGLIERFGKEPVCAKLVEDPRFVHMMSEFRTHTIRRKEEGRT